MYIYFLVVQVYDNIGECDDVGLVGAQVLVVVETRRAAVQDARVFARFNHLCCCVNLRFLRFYCSCCFWLFRLLLRLRTRSMYICTTCTQWTYSNTHFLVVLNVSSSFVFLYKYIERRKKKEKKKIRKPIYSIS